MTLLAAQPPASLWPLPPAQPPSADPLPDPHPQLSLLPAQPLSLTLPVLSQDHSLLAKRQTPGPASAKPGQFRESPSPYPQSAHHTSGGLAVPAGLAGPLAILG